MSIEGIRLKINEITRKMFAKNRVKNINNYNFTIISNNCWAGMVYESYHLKKCTPTIGLYFYSDDYIQFIKNMKYYIHQDLKFISPSESKWKDKFNNNKMGTFPIAKLKDIEIFFLHYHSEEEAIEKWNRRIKRINFDNIIFKFNDQNDCTEKNIIDFFNLPYKNKIFFTVKDWKIENKNIFIFKQPFNKDFILSSYEPIGNNRVFNVNEYINHIKRDDNL